MTDDHRPSHTPPWRLSRVWWVPFLLALLISAAGAAGVLVNP
ncbi:hypothetical protein OEB99_16465 [Actinotalea sp. M2MS4P-6]|nr:hypothetical protein [Actinotalea sp. M2MS4P-6]MCV2395910.1 hypothetical protein [Actinotalea sp. M2MS4P-6]